MRDSLFRAIARHFPTERIGRNRFLAAVWRVLYYLIRPQRPFAMRTEHYRCVVHPRRGTLTRALIRRGHWEPLETRVFVSLLKPGATVVDAGANFGHYAMVAANRVGAGGAVFAFEPHGPTFALLAENAELQPCSNLYPVRAGLGAEDGEMPIFADASNPGGHSFLDWNRRDDRGAAESVPVRTLDGFLAEHAPGRALDVLKIDVQGLEMDVLRGAGRTIARDRPAILCEVTPGVLARVAGGHRTLLSFLAGHGYEASVVETGTDDLSPMETEALAVRLDTMDDEYLDVLFTPGGT